MLQKLTYFTIAFWSTTVDSCLLIWVWTVVFLVVCCFGFCCHRYDRRMCTRFVVSGFCSGMNVICLHGMFVQMCVWFKVCSLIQPKYSHRLLIDNKYLTVYKEGFIFEFTQKRVIIHVGLRNVNLCWIQWWNEKKFALNFMYFNWTDKTCLKAMVNYRTVFQHTPLGEGPNYNKEELVHWK